MAVKNEYTSNDSRWNFPLANIEDYRYVPHLGDNKGSSTAKSLEPLAPKKWTPDIPYLYAPDSTLAYSDKKKLPGLTEEPMSNKSAISSRFDILS